MADRQPLLALLERYRAQHPGEEEMVARIRSLVEGHTDCFERTCLPGHITASSWILSPDRQSVLLTHHRKLDRWLQLGGHADGDSDVLQVALREAREESGMEHFAVHDRSLPLDVDVHVIPARGVEPEHEHHDLRFLLFAQPGQSLQISAESKDLAWVPRDRLLGLEPDESVLRMARKAERILAALH